MERGLISVTKKNTLKNAFVLDDNSLCRLQKFMEDFYGNDDNNGITYSVTLKNRQTRSSLNLEEVLKIENVKKTRIESLTVSTPFFSDNRLIIGFGNSFPKPIEYELSLKNEEKFLYYEEKINEFCESLKPTYSFIFEHPLVTYMLLIIPSYYFFTSLFLWVLNYFDFYFLKFDNFILELAILGLYIFLSLIVILKIFPIGQFKIGYGVKIFEELKWLRNSVLGVLVLGLFGSLITKVFFG